MTGTLSIQLLTNGVEDCEHVFVQKLTAWSTLCEPTMTVYDLFCVIGLLKYSVIY